MEKEVHQKVILVTGATAGIGNQTAKELAKWNSTVVIVSRDSRKGEETVKEIQAYSGNNNVSYLTADLSSQKEIRQLANRFREKYNSLDVLVNNAGIFCTDLKYSADGIELQFATNHLSYFLLTNLLIDLLKKSSPSRIVNVSSEAHYRGTINFEDLNLANNYDGFKAYRQSKLGNVLFTYELAERLKGTGVTVNCLHPGGVNTKLGDAHTSGWVFWAWRLAKPFFISVKKGAATSIYLASSQEVEGVTGKYFDLCKPRKSADLSYDKSLMKKLWKMSDEMVGQKFAC